MSSAQSVARLPMFLRPVCGRYPSSSRVDRSVNESRRLTQEMAYVQQWMNKGSLFEEGEREKMCVCVLVFTYNIAQKDEMNLIPEMYDIACRYDSKMCQIAHFSLH